ncbi:MAG: superoxide dismutase [Chloroflexota bacterium]
MPSRISRRIAIVIAAAALLLLPGSFALAQSPDRLDLPDGWAPEGVTALEGKLYVGSLADGAIWQVDPATGDGSILVPGVDGAVAVGVEGDAANGRIWVAGGRTGEVRAYDAESGELLETYRFDAGFLNDLVATPVAVYISDSFTPQIAVVPLGPDGSLSEPSAATTMPISGDLVYDEGAFNANGIVSTPAGLVVVTSQAGTLFRIDPQTGESSMIDVGDVELRAGDGLELDGQTLYVVRNQVNTVAVLELDEAVESASLTAELTSDELDIPATAALLGDDLWAANARFGTRATPETQYWLTRLDTAAGAEG